MTKNETGNAGILSSLPTTALCALMGLSATLLLLFFAAVLVSGGSVAYSWSTPMTAAGCFIGASAAGLMAARSAGERMLVFGLIAGAIYLGALLLLGFLFFPGVLPSGGLWVIPIACMAGGALGGMAATALPTPRRR